MNRKNFYFRQKVKASELDAAFDDVANALASFLQGFGYVGIATGAEITENSPANLTVVAAGPAIIYDQTQRHIRWSPDQTINCALDESGAATAVASPGNEKWLSIFAKFEEQLSDPRIDGNSATVYHVRSEGFSLQVVQGAEALLSAAVKPPLRGDEILLADVKLIHGQTQIVNADIDTTRTEVGYTLTGSPLSVRARGLVDVLQQMLDQVNLGGVLSASNTFTEAPQFVDTNDSTKALVSTTKRAADDPAGSARKLIFSAPGVSSGGEATWWRAYVTSFGDFELTLNAVWNPVADNWSADQVGGVQSESLYFAFRAFPATVSLQHKDPFSAPWTVWDTVPSSPTSGSLSITGEYRYVAAKTRTKLISLMKGVSVPSAPSVPWNISSAAEGPIWITLGTSNTALHFPIEIPNGATLTRVRALVNASSGTNTVTMRVQRKSGATFAPPAAPVGTDLANAASVGTGLQTIDITPLAEVVDSNEEVSVMFSTSSATSAVLALEITYTSSIPG